MGKRNRRPSKRQQNIAPNGNSAVQAPAQEGAEAADWKKAMQTAMAEENFGEALNILAKIIEAGHHEPELLYQGALAYFRLGDYTRAASWVSNTLHFAAGHIEARLLLARICIVEERDEDALAVCEYVLEHSSDAMSGEMESELQDILSYYAAAETDKIKANYPHIAAFLKLETAEKSTAAPGQTAASEAEKEATALSSMLAKMKELTDKKKAAAQAAAAPKEDLRHDVPAVPVQSTDDAVQDNIQAILVQAVSLPEKIKMLNAFAGAAYFVDGLMEARRYLEEALKLDGFHAQTLTNLAIVEKNLGNKDEALNTAAKLPMADFALLDILRD